MKRYTIIHPDNLERNLMNNMEVVKQMVNLYLGLGHQDFAELQQAVVEGEFDSIQNKAHHIKPTMAYIGAAVLPKNSED